MVRRSTRRPAVLKEGSWSESDSSASAKVFLIVATSSDVEGSRFSNSGAFAMETPMSSFQRSYIIGTVSTSRS